MRNKNMDVVRGIAVLGLMYMNVYFFGLFEFGYVPQPTPPLSDYVIQTVNLFFIDGRFRTLFCLLFGAGLYIQWQRYQNITILKKRLKVLAVFGLLHGFLLWAGDILFIYACAGWLTCKYLNADNSIIIRRAWQFLFIGALMSMVLMLVEPYVVINRTDSAFLQSYEQTLSSLGNILGTNALMFVIMIIAVPLITLWMSAAVMLVGVYLYRLKVFDDGLPTASVRTVGCIAFLLSCLRVLLEYQHFQLAEVLKEPLNWLAALFTALLLIHIIVKAVHKDNWITIGFMRLGRMSLTAYISQTVCLFLLFKIVYPHWVLSFNRIDYLYLVTVLALIQYFSFWLYSCYFKLGPLELVWRKLSR